MALRAAVASGNWSNPAIWNGGVLPTVGDIVASNTYTVTIDQNINVDVLSNAALTDSGLVPTMTSDTTPSGIVSASSTLSSSSYPPWRAFDKNNGTFWASSTSGPPQWLEYEFPSPTIVNSYVLLATNTDAPVTWEFQAWDGTSWVVLQSIINAPKVGIATTYNFTNTTAYSRYRMYMLAPFSQGYMAINELTLRNSLSAANSVAGGGFILNDGVTVTCTNATAGVINGNSTCITFSTLGTYYINAKIVNNGTANCINITAAITLYIVGEITNFSGNGFTTINAAAACVVYITGNVRGTGTPGGRCIVTSNNAEVRITGNVTTLNAGNANRAIIISNLSRVFIVGNVFYESTHSTNSDIISNSGYLSIVGTLNAFSTNGGFYLIVSTASNAINIFTGPFISSPEGIQPIYVARMHYQRTMGSYYEFRDNSTNGALPPAGAAPATRLVSPDTVVDAPIPANVRQGVVYASGSQTGTMIVPSPSNVANNVPVDNTVGTAVLDPNAIWAVPLTSINTLNSIGRRVKNAATVETTGAQIQQTLNSNE